jgi:hypothetical protein
MGRCSHSGGVGGQAHQLGPRWGGLKEGEHVSKVRSGTCLFMVGQEVGGRAGCG